MAWRFKASKYKNAAPVVPKFENLIRDVSVGSFMSHGNFIAASAAYFAFNWDTSGSNLAVLPIDAKGRQNKQSVPLIHAHPEFVTDFQFSPFDDGLLATGSQDTTVKVWRIPEVMPAGGLTQPECTLEPQPRRIETVSFNPVADCVLATSSSTNLVVWDLIEQKAIFSYEGHDDDVQSVGWQTDGRLLATTCRDRNFRIVDPRSSDGRVSSCGSHQGLKDSKVVWLSDGNRILTTGFSSDRLREITIRDLRSLDTPQKNLTLDMSSGSLVPLYDPDTNMCFLCGKGDRDIQFVEVTNQEPFIVEGLNYSGDQTKGACLVPKRAMDVMQGEVNRVLQLCSSSVVPVTWQVPRKSYREYHQDIYPETNGYDPPAGPEEWCRGDNLAVPKINLDPKKRPKEVLAVFRGPLTERTYNAPCEKSEPNGNGHVEKPERKEVFLPPKSSSVIVKPSPCPRTRGVVRSHVRDSDDCSQNGSRESPDVKPRKLDRSVVQAQRISNFSNPPDAGDEGLAALRRQPSIKDRKKMFEENIRRNQKASCKKDVSDELQKLTEENKENPLKVVKKDEAAPVLRKKDASSSAVPAKPRPVSKMFGRICKFKHLKGDVMLKGKFENLKNLSRTVPAECNFFHANPDRVAVPLTGAGGKIAVFETKKPGRIADGVQPVLINGTTVMDFMFDPFDNARLVAGCDDGHVRLWRIPEGGLTQQNNEPETVFPAHGEKVQLVKFHPLAENVLLTAAFDRTVRIWKLDGESPEAVMELTGHSDQVFSAEWSPCGGLVATVSKDGRVRVYDPRVDTAPVREGAHIVPKKGARILWVLQGEYLVVCGFSKQSERQVMLFRSSDLEQVNKVDLDVSPTILVPYYDEGSSTLFVTGKGESTVTTFEIARDPPHLFALAPYKPSGLHQGFAFLPKVVCNVRDVEFARAYRLTNTTIEPISFSVPRVKTAFFQDDLFPPSRVLWKATLSSQEWLSGSSKQPDLLDMRPEDMKPLSNAKAAAASSAAPPPVGVREEEAQAAKPKEPENENSPPPKMERIMQSMLNVDVGIEDEPEDENDNNGDSKDWE